MSEIVILFILCRYDSTIYKITKIMEEMFFAFLKPSLGTVSPAIKRLSNLGCIEIQDKMSEGGMLSKTCSITPYGKKYLKELLLGLEFLNPAHIISNVKIALFCSSVLEGEDKEKFTNNIKNYLILHKGKINEGLKNPYVEFNDMQKSMIEASIKEADEILAIL